MCYVFYGYHAVAPHVKLDHDIYGSANQSEHISIQSQRWTWIIFAEAYEADARDFGLSCPKYTLTAIMQWHLNYEGPKIDNDDTGLSQDPLVLCSVTSHVVDLTQGSVGDLPTPGPLPSPASVQQPVLQPPPCFEDVVHTVDSMIPGEDNHTN